MLLVAMHLMTESKNKNLDGKKHNTVEDVSRDADEEDDGVEVADEDVVYGGQSLIGDDVVGVVPRSKAIHVTHSRCFHCGYSEPQLLPPLYL